MPHFPLPWLGLLAGERQWPCDGCCVSVWAVCQRAGSARAQCTMAALLQEGDLHPLAQSKWGQCGHQSHLPTDRPRCEVWGVPVWQGKNTLRFCIMHRHFSCWASQVWEMMDTRSFQPLNSAYHSKITHCWLQALGSDWSARKDCDKQVFTVGFNDLQELLQPKWFYDSMLTHSTGLHSTGHWTY